MNSENSGDPEVVPFVEKINLFKEKYFSQVTDLEWDSWKWQLQHAIKTTEELQNFIKLTKEETTKTAGLPLKITPYYLSLFYNKKQNDPLRKTMVPTTHELIESFGEQIDPLGENHDSPMPGLVHRYPDRVLILATNTCSANCRYCTRSRIIENDNSEHKSANIYAIINYIKNNKQIRDVILSGGDPLIMSDDKLEFLLKTLRDIKHVEMIRIGTKVPFVLPQRITDDLVNMIKKYHPVFMSIHSTHPNEITPESKIAVLKLADAGIVLGSQTVLLKGINDNSVTLKNLFHELLKLRVRPYYLYQCDPIKGSAHFKTKIDDGLNIIKNLRGHTSGYAIPQFVIDAPNGGGKIPILPESVVSKDEKYIYLKNYEAEIFKYPL